MRWYFVFFIFSLIVNNGLAQHILVGPKVGVQVCRAAYEDKKFYHDFSSELIGTYQAGVVSNIKVSELFSLETEIIYNQTGKKIIGKDQYSLVRERYEYLTFPLLLRASYRHGYQQYYFNVGPNLSYWLRGTGKIRIPELLEGDMEPLPYTIKFGEGQISPETYYISDPNRLLLGLDVGAGAMLPINQQFLMLDLRFTWAHTNLGKKEATYMDFLFYKDRLAHANHVLSFSVAYLFEFDFLTMMTKGKSKSIKKN